MKYNRKQHFLKIAFVLLLLLTACNTVPNSDSKKTTTSPSPHPDSMRLDTSTSMFFIDESLTPTHIGAYDIQAFTTNIGIETGNILISALETYIVDHLEPPKELSELVPIYINQVPSGPLSEFLYITQPSKKIVGNELYSLSFERNKMGLTCEYLRYVELWDCGYYIPEQLRTLTPP